MSNREKLPTITQTCKSLSKTELLLAAVRSVHVPAWTHFKKRLSSSNHAHEERCEMTLRMQIMNTHPSEIIELLYVGRFHDCGKLLHSHESFKDMKSGDVLWNAESSGHVRSLREATGVMLCLCEAISRGAMPTMVTFQNGKSSIVRGMHDCHESVSGFKYRYDPLMSLGAQGDGTYCLHESVFDSYDKPVYKGFSTGAMAN